VYLTIFAQNIISFLAWRGAKYTRSSLGWAQNLYSVLSWRGPKLIRTPLQKQGTESATRSSLGEAQKFGLFPRLERLQHSKPCTDERPSFRSWYSLGLAVFNTFPFLNRGLSESRPLRAFVKICCHRSIGVALGSLAWRVPIAQVPPVSFSVMLFSALGAVRASKVYAEHDSGNLYVHFLCDRLDAFLLSARVHTGKLVQALTGNRLPVGDALGAVSEPGTVTPRQTVLLLWLVLQTVTFWVGFHFHLRDEVLEREAFLQAHRRNPPIRSNFQSVKPMMMYMAAVQGYVFALLLMFGDQFV
jgi:hypothetical protein